jgi:protein-S-isoprenylcysteine O-methyltransferase Ste14
MNQTPVLPAPWANRLDEFVAGYRVQISFVVFGLLIAENLLWHQKPRDLLNVRDLWSALGVSLVLGGLAIRSWAAGVLKGKALATTGPYSLCRHPLYLGSYMLMLGFCVLLNSVLSAAVILGPILVLYLLTIRREERRLGDKHPGWAAYASRTPCLFPYRWNGHLGAEWSASQWMRNREYNATLTVLLGLVAIQVWYGM